MVGVALRTRDKVSPLYVSIGHKVDLDTAMRYVLASSKGYRMPEPTRLAHQAAAGKNTAARSSCRPGPEAVWS